MTITSHHIEIYKSLFRGREDIYAVRKEKGGKAGYMPEYDVDWTHWKEHQARGGGFDSYKYKKPVPLDDSIILSHLKGEKTCGIYPLMSDNTSFFIAVDFDGMNLIFPTRTTSCGRTLVSARTGSKSISG